MVRLGPFTGKGVGAVGQRIVVRRKADGAGRVEKRRRFVGRALTKGMGGPQAQRTGEGVFVLLDRHLQFIEAELDAVAAPQLLMGPTADRLARLVEEGAVGAEVLQAPFTGVMDQQAVPFREVAVRVGDDPLVVRPPANGELSAANFPSLRRHIVGAADHGKLQGHVLTHS